jgi:hypothetical protein
LRPLQGVRFLPPWVVTNTLILAIYKLNQFYRCTILKGIIKYSIAFVFVFLVVFFTSLLLKPVNAQTEPFEIAEMTEYGLSRNTVFIEITNNLGEDQHNQPNH